MASFIDINGERQQIELSMSLYKEASAKRLSLRQLVNQKFPTAAGQPETFKQLCVSSGLRFAKDEETGIPATNLIDIFDTPQAADGTFITRQTDSRILFPAALMEAVENKLNSKEDVATGAFESLVGFSQTIASNRLEQPVINFQTPDGPEQAQFKHISQNTRPPLMLSITASDISRKIPTTAIGMEMSFEALATNSIDFVALTMARFYKMANYNEWISQLSLVLNGDPDATVTSMSAANSALGSITAQSLDSGVTTNGTISQKAWLKYLYHNSTFMTKTHIICDFDTALAIDNRANRPTNMQNNSVDRLDVPFRVSYPSFNKSVDMVVMPAGTFVANNVLGLDKEYALAKVTSSSISYEAVEDMVIKKSREMRIDRGFIIYRMFDNAFDRMTLTV